MIWSRASDESDFFQAVHCRRRVDEKLMPLIVRIDKCIEMDMPYVHPSGRCLSLPSPLEHLDRSRRMIDPTSDEKPSLTLATHHWQFEDRSLRIFRPAL